MTDTSHIQIVNFKGTKEYDRIYFSDNDTDRIEQTYTHTGFYDIKEEAFLTVGVHSNIDNYNYV